MSNLEPMVMKIPYPFIHINDSHKKIAKYYAKKLSASMKFHNKPAHEWQCAQGILGEVCLAHMLGCLNDWRQHKEEQQIENDWDDGYDLIYNGLRIDCKTMTFRKRSAIPRLGMFVRGYGGSDLYVQMLLDELDIRIEKGFDSIDWIDTAWCAGWCKCDAVVERYKGKLRYPIAQLRKIKEIIEPKSMYMVSGSIDVNYL